MYHLRIPMLRLRWRGAEALEMLVRFLAPEIRESLQEKRAQGFGIDDGAEIETDGMLRFGRGG